jgi:ElaA protein
VGDDLTLHRATAAEIGAGDLYAILKLRSEVFVVEQACAYLDPDGRDLEPATVHLWFTDAAGRVAACVRVLAEPTGGSSIGRVVTHPAHRGHHVAGRLIDEALAFAPEPVVLKAQSHLVHIYGRHGFVPDGAEFVEDDIPHTPMRLVR